MIDPVLANSIAAAAPSIDSKAKPRLANAEAEVFYAEAIRELLALRIIEIAQLGERDPARLREDALAYLARTNLKSTGL